MACGATRLAQSTIHWVGCHARMDVGLGSDHNRDLFRDLSASIGHLAVLDREHGAMIESGFPAYFKLNH